MGILQQYFRNDLLLKVIIDCQGHLLTLLVTLAIIWISSQLFPENVFSRALCLHPIGTCLSWLQDQCCYVKEREGFLKGNGSLDHLERLVQGAAEQVEGLWCVLTISYMPHIVKNRSF